MMSYAQVQNSLKQPLFVVSSSLNEDHHFRTKPWGRCRRTPPSFRNQFQLKCWIEIVNGKRICQGKRIQGIVCEGILFPMNSWAPEIDSPVIASQLSAFSLLPYVGFLYFITKSKSAPGFTLFGFYFLLAFVAAAIPAGICAKVHYGASLSNVDWLHGGAESLLMLTNLFIVLGLREALRNAEDESENALNVTRGVREEEGPSI